MKTALFKNQRKFIFLLTALITIAYSCRKDFEKSEQHNTNADAAPVADAKAWYQSTYPFKGINHGKKAVADIGSATIDFSQLIQPDWDNADTYERFDDEVIELPVETSDIIYSGLQIDNGTQTSYNKEYSRSSFLLLRSNNIYSAYVMTLIGDSTYVNNDTSKLSHNKYNNRDSDFGGVVLYSTPEGHFINGWFYKNGQITARIIPNKNTFEREKSTNTLKTHTYTTITYCTYYTQTVEANGVTYGPIYLSSSCRTISVDSGSGVGGGGGSGAASGGASGGGSSSPGVSQPSPCTPGLVSVKNTKAGGLKTHANAPANPGTGFPPPTTPPPCDVVVSPEEKLAQELAEDPTFLLDCKIVTAFKALATYKTPTAVNTRMDKLNDASKKDKSLFWDPFYVQQVKNAFGYQINLDRFEINVKKLPKVNGKSVTASQLLNHIRLNLNNFINKGIATFVPYVDNEYNIDDSNVWKSTNPLGAILHLEMKDMGSVIVSDYANDHWTVSTLRTPLDDLHPVSGNRSWGFINNTDGSYTFYVTGADRLTATYHQLFQAMAGVPFSKADELWTSYQTKLSAFINSNDGTATIGATTKERPNYADVKDYLDGKITIKELKAKGGCK